MTFPDPGPGSAANQLRVLPALGLPVGVSSHSDGVGRDGRVYNPTPQSPNADLRSDRHSWRTFSWFRDKMTRNSSGK